jgi:hypothetical protein
MKTRNTLIGLGIAAALVAASYSVTASAQGAGYGGWGMMGGYGPGYSQDYRYGPMHGYGYGPRGGYGPGYGHMYRYGPGRQAQGYGPGYHMREWGGYGPGMMGGYGHGMMGW